MVPNQDWPNRAIAGFTTSGDHQVVMIQRALRFAIERPVEYRFTDVRGGPRFKGRTINISSTGVLMQNEQRIGVGRRMELLIRMTPLAPGGPEFDLRLLGITVRSGEGFVAVQARKSQILKRAETAASTRAVSGILPDTGSNPGRIQHPAA
jgi:hypothetical protein